MVVKADELKIFLNAGGRIGRFALMMPSNGTVDARTAIVEALSVMLFSSSSSMGLIRYAVIPMILQ